MAPGSAGDGMAGGARPTPTHGVVAAGAPAEQVTLRSATELADALPYLLGYRPEDSIVLVTVHDRHGHGSFGGRARLGIPERAEDWPTVARQLARCLVSGCERRGARPEGMVAFVCREPSRGETGRQVMEVLRPLAQLLRTECGSLDVPVLEALCISDGRFWSYCCPGPQCCSEEGTPMGLPGSSVLSAAMTYAGFQVRGTLKEFRARLIPWETAAALDQQVALDAAGMALTPMILDEAHRAEVAVDTLDLARRLVERLAGAPRVSGLLEADQQDDELIAHDEAAALIFGLQDRTTRDRAAEWMEGEVCGPALRLWRALARRCVGPYGEYAAAPLTLAGWVAWSMGDELEAREALAMALGANPDYTLARLLHQACNEGVGPEAIRRCLRQERAGRSAVGWSATDVSATDWSSAGGPPTALSRTDWPVAVPSADERLPDARDASAAAAGERPGAAPDEGPGPIGSAGDPEPEPVTDAVSLLFDAPEQATTVGQAGCVEQATVGEQAGSVVQQTATGGGQGVSGGGQGVSIAEQAASGGGQGVSDVERAPRAEGAHARAYGTHGTGSDRPRPSGGRGETRGGPRSTRHASRPGSRPGSGRAAATGPGLPRPPRRRRTTGRG